MKAFVVATALLIGSAAYAQSADMPPPAPADSSPNTGMDAPSAGADAAAQPSPMPSAGSTDATSGATMPAQTADSGPIPRCSRKVTDHCVEKR